MPPGTIGAGGVLDGVRVPTPGVGVPAVGVGVPAVGVGVPTGGVGVGAVGVGVGVGAVGVGVGAVGVGVGVGVGAVGVGVGAVGVGAGVVGSTVGVALGVAVGVGVTTAVTKLLMFVAQVTVAPPPLPDPLHWLTETRSAEVTVDVGTVQVTRPAAPPPLPEPLHCVTSAPVVLETGLQAVPPAAPSVAEPTHWFTVAGVVVLSPTMLLVMSTLQMTLLPPPFATPLHWSTAVMMIPSRCDTVVVQRGAAPAAPAHTRVVTVDDPVCVATFNSFTTVTSHSTWSPPPLGVSLHWDVVVGETAADADCICPVTPTTATSAMSAAPAVARTR